MKFFIDAGRKFHYFCQYFVYGLFVLSPFEIILYFVGGSELALCFQKFLNAGLNTVANMAVLFFPLNYGYDFVRISVQNIVRKARADYR